MNIKAQVQPEWDTTVNTSLPTSLPSSHMASNSQSSCLCPQLGRYFPTDRSTRTCSGKAYATVLDVCEQFKDLNNESLGHRRDNGGLYVTLLKGGLVTTLGEMGPDTSRFARKANSPGADRHYLRNDSHEIHKQARPKSLVFDKRTEQDRLSNLPTTWELKAVGNRTKP